MLIHKQLSERLLSFIAMDQQMYIWMNCGTLALIHTGCSPFEWKYCLHILVYSLHCYLFPCTLFLVRWFIRALPQHTQLRDLWKGLLRIRYSLNISVLCLCFYFYLSLSLLCFFPSYLIVFSIADHIVTTHASSLMVRRFVRTIKDDARVVDNVVGEENRDAVLESLMVPTTIRA